MNRTPAEEKGRKPLSSFWAPIVGSAMTLLALAYVAPNHAPPWMSFVQEAAAALALLIMAASVLWRVRGSTEWRAAECVVLGLAAVPMLQFSLGKVVFLQTAWMHSLYLLGLLLALQAGSAMERRSPQQALWALMLPVWLAAIVSVALQLTQWLVMEPGVGTLWVYRAIGARPAANLGQPNAVATLLVLGLLATFWMWRQGRIGAAVACGVAAYLSFGIALTQSRAGLLNALLVAAALLAWRRGALRRSRLPVIGLLGFLLAAFVAYPMLSVLVDRSLGSYGLADRTSADVRPLTWRLFLAAIGQMPLTGYGWGQAFAGQLAAALDHPALHRVFLSAHNIALDLALWSGIPLAIAVLAAVAAWGLACWRRAADEADLLLLLFIAVPLVHALFEYPLHYAYFLLPAGVAAGALNERLQFRPCWRLPAGVSAALCVAGAVGFGVTVRDYLRVEESFRELLLEKARIERQVPATVPDVWVLTSLRDLIVVSRLQPHAGMPASELALMSRVLQVHPSATGFARLAEALALNGQPAAAQQRVDLLCRVFDRVQCAALAVDWRDAARQQPALQAIHWP